MIDQTIAKELAQKYIEACTEIKSTLTQMVRLGNLMNWNPPIDQEYVDAINALRALLDDEKIDGNHICASGPRRPENQDCQMCDMGEECL